MLGGGEFQDLDGLSRHLGFAPQHLWSLISNSDSLYKEFSIPKRAGGIRKITAPTPQLKGVQRAILRKILTSFGVSNSAFAYVKGRSSAEAAHKLAGRKHVLKMDIENFFPSISSRRVLGLISSFGFSSKAAYMLTRLCTYQDALCQGAPTSPHIANLICRKMDTELNAFAISWGMEYLRYSDDIFFSKSSMFNWKHFSEKVTKIVRENGFKIKISKTRFYCRGKHRMTLGLETSGSTAKFTRMQQRIYRAAFYKASKNPKWAVENIDKLRGMLSWHKLVYEKDEKYFEYRRIIDVAGRIRLHEAYSI
jgi:RNA-directed DNA polymerase